MNKEKIVSKIERYVGSLSEEQRQMYNSGVEWSPIYELAEIVQELKREIKEQAQKETHGNAFVKRQKLVAKLLAGCNREDLRKAFYEEINGEKMQVCLIDGYYAFIFKDAFDVPMYADGENAPFTIKKALPDYTGFDACAFDIAEIKTTLKLHKASKKHEKCVCEVGGKWYDAKYFVNVVDGLGGNVVMYQNASQRGADVFESENGLAILCPCTPPR